jgi:3-polyprenyl-4-hydroxybenzoate decarboxylase
MPFKDLWEFIAHLEDQNELRRIRPVAPKLKKPIANSSVIDFTVLKDA